MANQVNLILAASHGLVPEWASEATFLRTSASLHYHSLIVLVTQAEHVFSFTYARECNQVPDSFTRSNLGTTWIYIYKSISV